MSEEYKKLSELPQAVNPQRCEAYGVEGGKSVRVPLNFADNKIFERYVVALEDFVQSTDEIHASLGQSIHEIKDAVFNQVKWSESFNLNNYKTQGIYYISGERLSNNDNLPILNSASGNSISGQLTVLDASLSETERCVTQYLKLSNRLGKEGKEYIRTYNRFKDGREEWSLWRELKGTMNLNQISDEQLKSYTENGTYEGVVNNGSFSVSNAMQEIEQFFSDIIQRGSTSYPIPTGSLINMSVMNNYAVVEYAKNQGVNLNKCVTQRVSVLMLNGVYVEIQRTTIGEDRWGNWTKINL